MSSPNKDSKCLDFRVTINISCRSGFICSYCKVNESLPPASFVKEVVEVLGYYLSSLSKLFGNLSHCNYKAALT